MMWTVSSLREAWAFWSVKVSGTFSVVVLTWLGLPDEKKAMILSLVPSGWVEKAPALFVLAGFVGTVIARLLVQSSLRSGGAQK